MAASRKCKDLFEASVTRVLNNWTALQLAVEHGMGGQHGQMMALKLVDYITEVFYNEENIEADEVTHILVEVMDSHFQTWCEDNSPDEIGNILWTLFQFCKAKNESELQKELSKLSVCQCSTNTSHEVGTSKDQITAAGTSSLENINKEIMEEVDSEWTEVTHKKRRHL